MIMLGWPYGSRGMVSNMKTTIDLPEALLRAAQRAAQEDHSTLKALVEQGLRTVLAGRTTAGQFTLKDASVDGNGLRPEFSGAGWDQVRDAIYGHTA